MSIPKEFIEGNIVYSAVTNEDLSFTSVRRVQIIDPLETSVFAIKSITAPTQEKLFETQDEFIFYQTALHHHSEDPIHNHILVPFGYWKETQANSNLETLHLILPFIDGKTVYEFFEDQMVDYQKPQSPDYDAFIKGQGTSILRGAGIAFERMKDWNFTHGDLTGYKALSQLLITNEGEVVLNDFEHVKKIRSPSSLFNEANLYGELIFRVLLPPSQYLHIKHIVGAIDYYNRQQLLSIKPNAERGLRIITSHLEEMERKIGISAKELWNEYTRKIPLYPWIIPNTENQLQKNLHHMRWILLLESLEKSYGSEIVKMWTQTYADYLTENTNNVLETFSSKI